MEKFEEYTRLCTSAQGCCVFLSQGDDISELQTEDRAREGEQYIVINNFDSLVVIDGKRITQEELFSDEYKSIILECKISKHIDGLNCDVDDNKVMAKIEIALRRAKKEARLFLKQVEKRGSKDPYI